jgi:hypothetical protein
MVLLQAENPFSPPPDRSMLASIRRPQLEAADYSWKKRRRGGAWPQRKWRIENGI